MLSLQDIRFFISSLVLTCSLFAHAQTPVELPAQTQVPAAPSSHTITPHIEATPANSFVALCYHDVSNGFLGNSFSIRKKDLIDQFEYLKAHYNVVGLQDIIDASQGKKTLPPKAVLLTFDDGLSSFYEIVYPLLKTYRYKAVFAVVGKWIDEGAAPDYGFKDTNPKMASWKQIKEMVNSGWVDIASHTYDMHQWHVFNPQGSQAAMASYFKYDLVKKSYQTEEDFSSQVLTDLKKNNELIKKHVGKDNTVMVWPYGASNALSRQAAVDAGMTIQMSLREGLNNASNLAHIGRGLIWADMDIPQFATALEQAFVDQTPLRMIRVDLDSLWKSKESETEQILGDLLEKTLALGANGVLLQAVSDSGDAYFATSQLKVRGDYLNRAAHTMRLRARVPYVFTRLPRSFLRNTESATAALRDLAKYTDIDGVFFEISAKENLTELPFDALVAAGRSVRPGWKFGVIGQYPTGVSSFDYVMLNTQQLEKEKPKLAESASQPAKLIVALPQDYKIDASHLLAQGFLNLFYDVNFKSFEPDADFKNVFSVRKPISSQQIKGEAK